MKYLLLISLVAFTAGLLYHVIRWGLQKSISIKFYEHENNALWYLWFLSFTLPLLPLIDHWLLFLAVGCIILVGAAPNFKGTKMEEYAHIGGAYLGIIFAFLYLLTKGVSYSFPFEFTIIYFPVLIPVVLMAIFTITARLIKLNNLTTWVEIAAYCLTVLGLYIL